MNPARHFTRMRGWLALGAGRVARDFRLRTVRRTLTRWQARFGEIRRSLDAFDQCSSAEFSSLAECLAGLDVQLAGLGSKTAELDHLLHPENGDRAHESAFELFRKSVDLAHSSLGIALSQEEELAQLEDGILLHRGEFARHHLMFQVLVLNIRTEAARAAIGSENQAIFASVAADMENMARQLHATVESTFSELETIVQEAADGRRQLGGLEADLQQKAHRSIEILRAELQGLQRSLAPCLTANQEISRLLGEARARTGDLITTLQYQDIVRQQLAHISEGFQDMDSHLTPHGTPGHVVDPAYVYQSARVQATHLQAARQSITGAAEALAGSGRSLLDTGADLVQRFTDMQQVAAGVFLSNRLGTLFKAETASLVEISARSESTNERIARLLDRIERTVRVFSVEITRHEYDVQLIALNAQVAAARLSEARALNKLTEETARLSASTAALARETGGQLAAMLDRLQAMRGESDRIRRTIDGEKADLAVSGTTVDEKLAGLNNRIQQATGESAATFTQAYEQVDRLLSGLQFPGQIAAAFAPAEEIGAGLLAACAPFADASLTQEGTDRLAAHHGRYTMQEEREAHGAAISAPGPSGTASIPANPEPAPVSAAVDGVELF